MARVLVPLAEGFEEMEATIIIDVLRRAGVEVVSAGLDEGPITAARKTRHLPDAIFSAIENDDFAMVVLPGGQPGSDNLKKHSGIARLLKRMQQEKKYIGAICAAPNVLRHHGIIKDQDRFVCFPGTESSASGGVLAQERVVVSGNVLTSVGPGSAFEFALELVRQLCGQDTHDRVKAALQLPPA
jgi:4-methyl-5(b-hydroxyethyl)-thiazole monophosphate biosynthesis